MKLFNIHRTNRPWRCQVLSLQILFSAAGNHFTLCLAHRSITGTCLAVLFVQRRALEVTTLQQHECHASVCEIVQSSHHLPWHCADQDGTRHNKAVPVMFEEGCAPHTTNVTSLERRHRYLQTRGTKTVPLRVRLSIGTRRTGPRTTKNTNRGVFFRVRRDTKSSLPVATQEKRSV